MIELVKVSETIEGQTVSGRELHEFLGIGKDFTSWIKDRITKYNFIDGLDYKLTLTKTGERQNVTKHEYELSIDMAKQLSMVENNEKGQQARLYFIDCEKKVKTTSIQLPQTYKEALLALVEKVEENEKLQIHNLMLEQVVAENEPKVSYFDEILKTKNTVLISQIAKDYGLTAQKLNSILQDADVQYFRGKQWLLKEKHQSKGYTKSDTFKYVDNYGNEQASMNTKWSQKGRLFIHQLLESIGIVPLIDREFAEVN